MKSHTCLLLSALLALGLFFSACPGMAETSQAVEAGAVVTFGAYEQDNNPDNGKEPIEWIVLDTAKGKCLLLSRDCLHTGIYNRYNESISWKGCSMRTWLNKYFLKDAFSKKEQKLIVSTTVSTPNNPYTGGLGGKNAKDRVFLLSIQEAEQYFPNEADRRAKPSAWNLAQNRWMFEPDESADEKSIFALSEDGYCCWALRSAGNGSFNVALVNSDGSFNYFGYPAYRSFGPIRPAMWVKSSVFSN